MTLRQMTPRHLVLSKINTHAAYAHNEELMPYRLFPVSVHNADHHLRDLKRIFSITVFDLITAIKNFPEF